MSATDELRALLDERGVEHTDAEDGHTRHTWWSDGDHEIAACDSGTRLAVYNLTTQQAIDATLGRGECHKLPSSGDKTCVVRHNRTGLTMEFGYWRCSVCGIECFEGARYCMGCGAKVVTS